MNGAARGLLLAVAIAALGGVTKGDGVFFTREKVPADVPYQRAILYFHAGHETLIVQSKYELLTSEPVDSLGWVVPVPTIPEISSVEANAAFFPFYLADLKTQPQVIHISFFFLLPAAVLFLVSAATLFVCLAQYPFVRRSPPAKAAWVGRFRWAFPGMIAGSMLSVGLLPRFTGKMGTTEVLKAEQVGIYDVKVIRAEDSNAITGWLKENGFGFGEQEGRVFQKYIDQGWCFVAAKIQPPPGTDKRHIAPEGVAAPLILKFASEKPIYPLALTATTGSETEILIYTLSEKKFTCGNRLKLRCVREVRAEEILRPFLLESRPQEQLLLRHLSESPVMLCKFKGRLTAAQMREDLTFASAPDNQPYRERRIVW